MNDLVTEMTDILILKNRKLKAIGVLQAICWLLIGLLFISMIWIDSVYLIHVVFLLSGFIVVFGCLSLLIKRVIRIRVLKTFAKDDAHDKKEFKKEINRVLINS